MLILKHFFRLFLLCRWKCCWYQSIGFQNLSFLIKSRLLNESSVSSNSEVLEGLKKSRKDEGEGIRKSTCEFGVRVARSQHVFSGTQQLVLHRAKFKPPWISNTVRDFCGILERCPKFAEGKSPGKGHERLGERRGFWSGRCESLDPATASGYKRLVHKLH